MAITLSELIPIRDELEGIFVVGQNVGPLPDPANIVLFILGLERTLNFGIGAGEEWAFLFAAFGVSLEE